MVINLIEINNLVSMITSNNSESRELAISILRYRKNLWRKVINKCIDNIMNTCLIDWSTLRKDISSDIYYTLTDTVTVVSKKSTKYGSDTEIISLFDLVNSYYKLFSFKSIFHEYNNYYYWSSYYYINEHIKADIQMTNRNKYFEISVYLTDSKSILSFAKLPCDTLQEAILQVKHYLYKQLFKILKGKIKI